MEVATRPEDLDKTSDSASLLMKRKLLGLGAGAGPGFLRSTTGRGVRAGEEVVILSYCRMIQQSLAQGGVFQLCTMLVVS
jgi:hypothetical protein